MKHRKNFRVNLHIILIAAIVLIAVVAVYRLYRWNKGTPLIQIRAMWTLPNSMWKPST